MAETDYMPIDGEPFPGRLDAHTAEALLQLARSTKNADVNHLIRLGMRRGLRHPRFAVQAIEAQMAQLYASNANRLAKRMEIITIVMAVLTAVLAASVIVDWMQ